MDYLPELAHNGHNWTTYASLVLCAISDEGLMGFLVGSERRPTHPAELIGRGEGWTPQTDDERAEVMAWRATDQLWTQRNAMVNYTIVSGIPDTIFGFMLHLKSPLEKWDYLEKCFGSIPRPESWLVAEEVERRSDSNVAAETGQDTHNSDESRDLPGSQNEPTDSPNDHAETESEYLTLETEVIDVRHEEPYLLVVEVGTMDSKQLDEGTNALEAPDEGSQCTGDKVEEDEDLPTTSSKALEPQGNLPFTTSERAETQTGHRKPKNEVADMQHMVDVLPMFEVGSTGQAWYGKHAKELQAPDEGGQHTSDEVERSRDLPKSSSEVHKPVGHPTGQAGERAMEDALRTSIKDSQRAQTNSKTIANIPDPLGTPTKLPTPQVEHSRLRNSPSAQVRSATSMETDLSHTRRSSKQREMKRLELDCKRAPRCPQQTYRSHSTCETPPDEAWGMGVYSSARVGWGDSTTTGSITMKLKIRGISANMVGMRAILPDWAMVPSELDKEIGGGYNDPASRDIVNLHRIGKALLNDRECQHSEHEMKWPEDLPVPPTPLRNPMMNPPKTFRDQCCHSRVKTDLQNLKNKSQQAERSMAIQNLATWDHVPGKEDNSGRRHGDATRSGYTDSCRVEESLLTDSGSQHSERKAKQADGSPAPPGPCPSSTGHLPRLYKPTHRRGRVKSKAENVSNAHMRQNAYHVQAATERPLRLFFAPSNRPLDSVRGLWTVNAHYNEVRCARQVKTRGYTHRTVGILMRLVQSLLMSLIRSLDPAGGSWILRVCYNGVRHAVKVETRGCTHHTAGIYMQLPQGHSNPSRRFRNTANTYWQKGVPPGLMQNDATRPRNLRMAKRLPVSSDMRRDNEYRAKRPNDSPAPSKPTRYDHLHTPWTLRDSRRCATIKTRSKNWSFRGVHFGTVPSVVESLLRLPTAFFNTASSGSYRGSCIAKGGDGSGGWGMGDGGSVLSPAIWVLASGPLMLWDYLPKFGNSKACIGTKLSITM
ncbi:hypothetical protein F5141DRAFT_1203383 [Pisolithus sp. B1]|nr:hypothetical protein F5141DRAFT_1203383 [Pisolithus sp. B1]